MNRGNGIANPVPFTLAVLPFGYSFGTIGTDIIRKKNNSYYDAFPIPLPRGVIYEKRICKRACFCRKRTRTGKHHYQCHSDSRCQGGPQKFLAEAFASEEYPIQDILDLGPIAVGVSQDKLALIAHKLILKRTSQSSAASFVTGIPGGLAMAATIPADVLQFFGIIFYVL